MRIHFISIGGSVMHQLAIALHKKGNEVTGSDDEIFEPAKSNLEKEGLLPKQTGWYPDKITKDIDAVILGMHAKEDNPELLKAKELGLKIYSFPEYIYEESKRKKRIAIGGSHGKTSTTAMLMHVLKENHLDFDYLVGARLEGFAQSVNITDAPIIVCEADEYPASTLEKRPKFHFLFPHIAVLTGIAWDHINVFPTFDFYLEQFKIFIDKIEPNGILIYNETDEVLKNLVEENKRNDIRYQPYHLPNHSIENGKTIIEIEGVSAMLKVFGNHNLLNLNAGYFVCKELGIDAQHFVAEIATFNGAAKRLEQIFENENTIVYRDFAHAPSKVKATIDAVKQQFPERKIIAVLELHTYSSLNEKFMQQYHGSMNSADVAVVFYASHALELKRMPPLPKAAVVAGFSKDDLQVMNDKNELISFLKNQSYNNSVLLLMSSGDYDGLDIQQFLKENFINI
ncbi:MAG: Mur ligase family protein [Arachidicoccus sp.]|nr:Mur ligase family protein [Arachidicoccus sp.]